MPKVGDTKNITVCRDEANFDRACHAARKLACIALGISEDGWADVCGDYHQFKVHLVFVGYTSFADDDHIYEFKATICG